MGRKEISPEELNKLRESAAGKVELTADDLDAVAGGDGGDPDPNTEKLDTLGCCGGWTAPTCIPCGEV